MNYMYLSKILRNFKPIKIALRLIMIYRKSESVYILKLSRSCLHQPTCSKYTLKAIHRFGLVKGGKLGLTRIYNCTGTKGHGGFDPVPPKKSLS